MDLLSEDGSFSGGDSDDSVEGATGFNRDTFKGELKKGYNRGVYCVIIWLKLYSW